MRGDISVTRHVAHFVLSRVYMPFYIWETKKILLYSSSATDRAFLVPERAAQRRHEGSGDVPNLGRRSASVLHLEERPGHCDNNVFLAFVAFRGVPAGARTGRQSQREEPGRVQLDACDKADRVRAQRGVRVRRRERCRPEDAQR